MTPEPNRQRWLPFVCIMVCLLLAGCPARHGRPVPQYHLARMEIRPLPHPVKELLVQTTGDADHAAAYAMLYDMDTIYIAPSQSKQDTNCYYVHKGRVYYAGAFDGMFHSYALEQPGNRLSFSFHREGSHTYRPIQLAAARSLAEFRDCEVYFSEPCLSRIRQTRCKGSPLECFAWVVKCI